MKSLGGVTILVVRGLTLWMVVPATFIAWVLATPYRLFTRRSVKLGCALGWADLNLIAALQRGLPERAVDKRVAFVPLRDIGEVSHKVRLLDLA